MRTLLCFAIWLACVLGVGQLVGEVHRPREPRVDADFAAWQQHKDAYDGLFFGSSRMYRGIVPEVFDERLAQREHALRSYNLGMRAMLPHETNELLRRVLAEQPERLKFVVLELADWAPRRENDFAARTVAWHDLPETVAAMRTRWLEDQSLGTRLQDVRLQFLQWGSRATALGLGAERARLWFTEQTRPRKLDKQRAEYDEALATSLAWRGHAPFSDREYAEGPTARHHRELQKKRYEFAEHVEVLHELNATDASTERFNLAALEDQIAMVRAAGVEIVYVTPPSFEELPVLHSLARQGHVPNFLPFDDPLEYPDFYDLDKRFDLRHLDDKGARQFSRVLANTFADRLDEGSF
jgi:hypothetical protein